MYTCTLQSIKSKPSLELPNLMKKKCSIDLFYTYILTAPKERNPCSEGNPCAQTAECSVQSERAVCKCPAGMIGDPFRNCFKELNTAPECRSDSDCSSALACINEKCRDPCAERNPCAQNAECRVSQHRPLCYCQQGWGGNPQTQCYKRKFSECDVSHRMRYSF